MPAKSASASPSVTAPADVARAIFAALEKRDLDTAMGYLTDETVDTFVAIGEYRGKKAIRGFFDELLAAFPDFAMTVERVVGDDTTAVVQWRSSGTFSGAPFQGVEATGKAVEVRGVDVLEIIDGHVQRNTIYYDGASFARQIGLLPRQGSGADKALLGVFNAVTNLRRHLH
ncbi:MAG TPA: ester cyclase [Acidimicrobiales bacterium]|nr:ester cyclase [Acidimicrobiales bacterium]